MAVGSVLGVPRLGVGNDDSFMTQGAFLSIIERNPTQTRFLR